MGGDRGRYEPTKDGVLEKIQIAKKPEGEGTLKEYSKGEKAQ